MEDMTKRNQLVQYDQACKQEWDLMDYLTETDKASTIFTVRWLYPSDRSKKATNGVMGKRKSLSIWLSRRLKKGPYRIGEFEIVVFNKTNPIKYVATRCK